MGWVWRDDKEDEFDSLAGSVSSGDQCSVRKVVKSQCRTEEVEPGKFIRKCENRFSGIASASTFLSLYIYTSFGFRENVFE